MKAERVELALATAGGLLVILGCISLSVLTSCPAPKSPEEKLISLLNRQAGPYFIDAEILAKRLWTDPSGRWSHLQIDSDAGCRLIGPGVWYAHGTVASQGDLSPKHVTWQVLFLPEAHQVLFVRVGSRQSGDPKFVSLALTLADMDRSEAGNGQSSFHSMRHPQKTI